MRLIMDETCRIRRRTRGTVWGMARVAVLLRGVNVGRAKRVPMADFRDLLADLGFTGTRTLLNSGNAVGDAPKGAARAHASRIHDALVERLSVDVAVIVKTAADLQAILAENPFAGKALDPSRVLVAFAPDAAALASLTPIEALVKRPEAFVVGAHAAYLSCPDGILTSKAGEALLGKVGRQATTRNWATVLKLEALLSAAE